MITIVAALAKGGVIGKAGRLPWSIPEELQHFKELTRDHTVIMGRKTFESLGGPLVLRKNIVLSRSWRDIPGVSVCTSIDSALAEANFDAFVIGGAEVFKEAIWVADRMVLSHIKKEYDGDVFFPNVDQTCWMIEKREDHPEFEVVTYKRIESH